MDRYRSHKVIEAFQIVEIGEGENATVLMGDEDNVTVDTAYMNKHQPQVGGYFVRYADGYESWSPAKAFEEGYTKQP